MNRRAQPATTVVGAGRLAGALVPALVAAGYPVVAVASRRLAPAKRLVMSVEGARATTSLAKAAQGAGLVLLAVPDRAIEEVAATLAARAGPWPNRTVLHHAGALGLEPLASLRREGAAVAVLHPLQCLGPPPSGAGAITGSHVRIEGDRRGRTVAHRLALDLGLHPLPLDSEIGPTDRAAYHAAASLVSNDVVALLSAAADLLVSLGLSRDRALLALLPLAEGTLSRARDGGIEGALTGPVARGDAATAGRQIKSLRRKSRDVAEAHRALSRILAGLADRLGKLGDAERRALRDVLGDKRR